MSNEVCLLTETSVIRSGCLANTPRLLSLPNDALRKIMSFTMSKSSLFIEDQPEKELLDVSHPRYLRDGLSFATTCRKMYYIFRELLTGIKLISSWKTEQKTLIAACTVAGNNLRSLHIECSAPVSTGLRQIACTRPPLKRLVLIGVNIAKVLISDIIQFLGHSLTKLTISAAPSLDHKIVELIARHCISLEYIELGCSRNVTNASLCKLFETVGYRLREIDLNALQHDSLDDRVLCVIAEHCTKMITLTLLKLKWVTDNGLNQVLTIRGHQLIDFRLQACRNISYHAFCILASQSSALQRLHITFEKENIHPTFDIQHNCRLYEPVESELGLDKSGTEFNIAQKALLLLSRRCQNLSHLTVSQKNIQSDPIEYYREYGLYSVKLPHVIRSRICADKTLETCLGKQNAALSYLDVSYLSFLTDPTLQLILDSQETTLQELRITGCRRLTDLVLREIIPQYASSLRILHLSYCNFSRLAVSELRKRLPEVTIRGTSHFVL